MRSDCSSNYISDSDADDVESMDSTNSALLLKVSHQDLMSIACYHWTNDLSAVIKKAWNLRARTQNHRPLPGRFVKVPKEISSKPICLYKEFVCNVLHSLTTEGENTYKLLKRCITNSPKAIMSSKKYRFGL